MFNYRCLVLVKLTLIFLLLPTAHAGGPQGLPSAVDTEKVRVLLIDACELIKEKMIAYIESFKSYNKVEFGRLYTDADIPQWDNRKIEDIEDSYSQCLTPGLDTIIIPEESITKAGKRPSLGGVVSVNGTLVLSLGFYKEYSKRARDVMRSLLNGVMDKYYNQGPKDKTGGAAVTIGASFDWTKPPSGSRWDSDTWRRAVLPRIKKVLLDAIEHYMRCDDQEYDKYKHEQNLFYVDARFETILHLCPADDPNPVEYITIGPEGYFERKVERRELGMLVPGRSPDVEYFAMNFDFTVGKDKALISYSSKIDKTYPLFQRVGHPWIYIKPQENMHYSEETLTPVETCCAQGEYGGAIPAFGPSGGQNDTTLERKGTSDK